MQHMDGYLISTDVIISIIKETKLYKGVHKLNFYSVNDNVAHTKIHPDCDIYNTCFYV